MAEFPESGRHCSLKLCNKLDFAPFQCKFCDNFFCGLHRFEHGCDSTNSCATNVAVADGSAKRQFLCSFLGCFAHEFVRIECSHCQSVFCLSHRQCEDHSCKSLEKANVEKATRRTTPATLPPPTSESGGDPSAATKSTTPKPKNAPPLLTAEQRARAERVAVIQLKMKNPLRISAEEQLFLFAAVVVEKDGEGGGERATEKNGRPATAERLAVMTSRFWSIGRAVDSIVKQLNLTTRNDKRWTAVKKSGEDVVIDLLASDDVTKHFADRDEILLRLIAK